MELVCNYSTDDTGTKQLVIPIVVSVRTCGRGETWTYDDRCNACSPGTYNLVPMSKIGNCSVCEEGAFCFGRDYIAPIKNYWRPDVNTAEFIPCLNNEACIAGS